MFFSTYVLTKSSPLAKIWLAAHWDKKLTSKDIRVIDLNDTVVQIVQHAVPIALRTSGELMLGVVRIYAAKVAQLLKDATEVTLILRPRTAQLVKGSGAAQAKEGGAGITMDLVVGRVGAEQLVEADFADIADILGHTGQKPAKRHMPEGHLEVIGDVWVPIESSQQLEDFAIATRASLGLPARGPASSSSGTKSSVEGARAAPPLPQNDFEMPAVNIDIPLPELPGPGEFLEPLGDIMMPPDAPVAGAVKPLRKIKPVTMVDANETTLSREQLTKNVEDRRDIVCQERRHGPLDQVEARDRQTLRSAADGHSLVSCASTLHVANPALAAAYQAALQRSVKDKIKEIQVVREPRPSAGGLAAPAVDPAVEPFGAPLGVFEPVEPWVENLNEPVVEEPVRKERQLSKTAAATLAQVKDLLSSSRGGSTKFSTITKSKTRVEISRTFVDILTLASLNYVSIAQAAPQGDITISSGPKMVAVA